MLEKKNFSNFFFTKEKNFLIYVDLFTKMCRIKFLETFRMNVGLPDLPKKSYLRKNVLSY